MLAKIKELAEANGWTTLRYTTPTATDNTGVRELILKGEGLSGDKEIYVGFRAYQVAASDYYNLSVAAFTGYVAANAFTAQPGYFESGVPAHNTRIDYWLCVNAQRICFTLKVGAGSYESGYTGFFFPYATPSQYPYPICCIGMLNGASATRYSDTNHLMGYRGYSVGNSANQGPNCKYRDVMGNWTSFYSSPWNVQGSPWRDTGNYYVAKKIALYVANNVWGELDGIRWISGFNQIVENTTTIGGKTNVVMRDVTRTGFTDYFLQEMD
jgi:hypothetical protein